MKKFLAISFCMLLCGTFIFTGCRSESANQSAPPTETPTAPPTEPPKEPTEECDILLSVFWPPMEGFTTEKQFDYLAEADIDLLEYGTDPIFTAPETIEAVLRLATEKGLKITIADRDFVNWDKKTDDEIRELVHRYKDYECVAGYFIQDEPGNANPLGRVARIMSEEDPGCIVQMNMLPMPALADARGHAEDWINAAGRENLQYLSYDQYPFGLQAGSVPQMFANMNLVRETGLKYDVKTALYIQSIGVVNGFRRPTVAETRYHTSAALAYGFKNLKYFTWITPVNRSEDFTTAIIRPDGEKSDTYDGIAAINKNIKKVSKILGRLDAVEIYHSGRKDQSTEMLKDWYIGAASEGDFLVSLMVDKYNGRNYLMIVNKDFQNSAELTFSLNGIDALRDITEGSENGLSVVIENGKFSASFEAGAFRLYELPEGLSLQQKESAPSGANLAKNRPVYASSSVGSDGYYAYQAVNGQRFSTKKNAGWKMSEKNEAAGYLTIDLQAVREFNRLDLYPAGIDFAYGALFPSAFSVSVSTDGVNYTKILSEDNYSLIPEKVPSFSFEKTSARYVRIDIEKGLVIDGQNIAELGEVEIYLDDGSVPSAETGKTIPESNGKNCALQKAFLTSSTAPSLYEQWGWKASHLNDGIIEQTSSHSGWTSQPGLYRKHPEQGEWVTILLGKEYQTNEVILYPCNNATYFPKEFTVEVSSDGITWTEVGKHTEDQNLGMTPRTVSFDTVSARFVKITATQMRTSGADGYMFQVAEIEVNRADIP